MHLGRGTSPNVISQLRDAKFCEIFKLARSGVLETAVLHKMPVGRQYDGAFAMWSDRWRGTDVIYACLKRVPSMEGDDQLAEILVPIGMLIENLENAFVRR